MPFVEKAEGTMRRRNDPNAKPPEPIKHLFKYWRKATSLDLSGNSSQAAANVSSNAPSGQGSALEGTEPGELIPKNYEQVLMEFCDPDALQPLPNIPGVLEKPALALEVASLPGMDCVHLPYISSDP